MTQQARELINHIQERCLWQFFSRAHDREENIEGVLGQLRELLSGKTPQLETPMDRCHFANANHLAREVRATFPWIEEMTPENLHNLIGTVRDRLREIAIAKSKNGELHQQSY